MRVGGNEGRKTEGWEQFIHVTRSAKAGLPVATPRAMRLGSASSGSADRANSWAVRDCRGASEEGIR